MSFTPTSESVGQRIPHSKEKDLPGNANWVVQKYGGTSLGKLPVNIAEDIILYVYHEEGSSRYRLML